MAGTAVSKVAEHGQNSMVEELRASLNKVIDDLEVLRAAWGGAQPAASELTAHKVNKLQ